MFETTTFMFVPFPDRVAGPPSKWPTLPKTNSSQLKIGHPTRKLPVVFQPAISDAMFIHGWKKHGILGSSETSVLPNLKTFDESWKLQIPTSKS